MRNFIIVFVFLVIAMPVYAIDAGKLAPNISVPLLTNGAAGKNVAINDFKGKLVYLDFWASWCGPCRQSFPILNDIRNKYQSKGFEVVAVNVDENINDALKFLDRYPVKYPILLDPKGTMPQSYNVEAMPTAYLIDRNGRVIHKHIGFRKDDAKKLETLIQHHLSGK